MEREGSTEPRGTQHALHYRLRVRGQLSARWAASFHGLTLTADGDTTLIHGAIADQAHLHGVLRQICDLGLELLSVDRGPPFATQPGTNAEIKHNSEETS